MLYCFSGRKGSRSGFLALKSWRLRFPEHREHIASSIVPEDVGAMQLPGAINKQHPALYTAGLFVVLIPLYYVSWQYNIAHVLPSRVVHPPSNDFVTDWLNVHLVEPFNPSAVGAYCNTTEWWPNLVFNLANANGGVGNVRGNILDFIFFAIEAGASIMLPGMASRSQSDISNVWASRAPFDHFFDEAWFLDAMSQACPQMAIYKPTEGQEVAQSLPGNYLPQTCRMDSNPEATKQSYLEHLNSWLSAQPTYHPDNTTLVNLERTLRDIDTRSLPSSFRRSFPNPPHQPLHPPPRRSRHRKPSPPKPKPPSRPSCRNPPINLLRRPLPHRSRRPNRRLELRPKHQFLRANRRLHSARPRP
jgi:hypothetical protein